MPDGGSFAGSGWIMIEMLMFTRMRRTRVSVRIETKSPRILRGWVDEAA
jgi:hypothetical protein